MQFDHNSKKIQAIILNSIGANAFGQILGALYQILAVPLYINAWGISLYGQWLILCTIPSYFALADIGLISAASNDLSIATSKNQHQHALKVFQSIWCVILLITIFALILVITFVILMPDLLLKNSLLDAQGLSIIIVCLSTYALLALQEGLINAGFRAGGMFTFSLWLGNMQRALEIGTILIALSFKCGPVNVSLLMLTAKIFSLVVYKFFLAKRVPWIRFSFSLFSALEIRRIIRPALGFLAFPVANTIKSQGIIALIGIFLGANEVVVFSSVRTICNTSLQLLKILQNSFWPEITNAFGRQNLKLFQEMNLLIYSLGFWLGLASLIGLLIFCNSILFYWTLGEIQAPILFVLLMCLCNFAAGIWSGGSVILMATSHHLRLGAHYVSLNLAFLVLIAFFGKQLNLLEYAATFFGAEIYLAIVVLRQTLALINQSFWRFAKDVIKLPIVVAYLAFNFQSITNFRK